jgi:hypothetical protein
MLFLVLLAPLQAPAQRRIVTLPFRSVNSYILAEASIDGRPVTLLVDTERTRRSAMRDQLAECNFQ